jgi:hypothetical protein
MQQPNQVTNQQMPSREAALCDCMEVNEQFDAAQSLQNLQLLR